MVNQVNGSPYRPRGLYANQPDRAAWREQMLDQFIEKSPGNIRFVLHTSTDRRFQAARQGKSPGCFCLRQAALKNFSSSIPGWDGLTAKREGRL